MSFDRVARPYRLLETIAFGNSLQRARVAWLAAVVNPVRALIVGEGNGRFLCELLRLHPQVEIDCIDANGRMLQLARERVRREIPADEQRVKFQQQDVRSWSPPRDCYDLIITHFVLDCFTASEIEEVVGKLGDAAASNAIWLLADFSTPTQGASRWRAQLWVRAMYIFFRTFAGISGWRLINPSPFLKENGFYRAHRRQWRAGLIKSEMWRRST